MGHAGEVMATGLGTRNEQFQDIRGGQRRTDGETCRTRVKEAASFGLALVLIPGTYLGFSLVVGGGILAYEALILYITARRKRAS